MRMACGVDHATFDDYVCDLSSHVTSLDSKEVGGVQRREEDTGVLLESDQRRITVGKIVDKNDEVAWGW